MLRIRGHEIVLGALLATALWAGIFAWESTASHSNEQPKTTSENQKSTDNTEENRASFSRRFLAPIGHFVREYKDEITAGSTAIIALFTTILGIFTISLASSTRKAADAANLNAQAVIDAERARLFLIIDIENITETINSAVLSPAKDDDRTTALRLKYSFKNYGKTPATIQEMGHGVVIKPDLPTARTFKMIVDIPSRIIGPNENSYPLSVEELPRLTFGEARSFCIYANAFWFYGFVAYDDMFGWTTRMNFVWHYDVVSRRFAWYSHDEKQEKRES